MVNERLTFPAKVNSDTHKNSFTFPGQNGLHVTSKALSMINHARIAEIVAAMLAKRGNAIMPTASQNLRDAGLTSLDMVNLMLAIEAEFDIEIPQSAMTPANFDTIAAIESLVTITAQAA